MPTSSRVTLDTRVLDAIIKNLDGNVTNAVAKAAFAVEGRAKINIQQMDAIDTGALLNSVAVSMQKTSDVDKAMSNARARRPEAGLASLPVPHDNHSAHIGPTVEYGEEVHNGSAHMAGRPYLSKALRETEAELRELLGKAVRNK